MLVIMLSVILLSANMLSVIMLSVIMLSVIMLSVISWVSLCRVSLCWMSLISTLCWVLLCQMSFWWMSFCWMSPYMFNSLIITFQQSLQIIDSKMNSVDQGMLMICTYIYNFLIKMKPFYKINIQGCLPIVGSDQIYKNLFMSCFLCS